MSSNVSPMGMTVSSAQPISNSRGGPYDFTAFDHALVFMVLRYRAAQWTWPSTGSTAHTNPLPVATKAWPPSTETPTEDHRVVYACAFWSGCAYRNASQTSLPLSTGLRLRASRYKSLPRDTGTSNSRPAGVGDARNWRMSRTDCTALRFPGSLSGGLSPGTFQSRLPVRASVATNALPDSPSLKGLFAVDPQKTCPSR